MKKILLICCCCICGLFATVYAQSTPALTLPEASLGNTNTAMPLTVTDFTDVVGLQLTIAWDPVALVLDSISDYQLPGLQPFSFNVDSVQGTMRFVWFDASLEGVSLDDGAAPFTMYFSAGDMLADTNHVVFAAGPTAPQLIQLDNGDFNTLVPELIDGFITLRPDLTLDDLSFDPVSCAGANDGSATAQLSGGLAPYQYFWDGLAGDSSIMNLEPGMVQLIAIDSDLDTIMTSFTILEPEELILTVTATDATCAGAGDGIIDLTVNGGTPEFTFVWSNDSEVEDQMALTAGMYSVSVTDANGCEANAQDILIEGPMLLLQTVLMNPSCATNDDGSIALETIDLAGITYQWDFNNATTATITGLSAGNYTVTITHPAGCEEVNSVELVIPEAVDPALTTIYGCGDGSVRIRSTPIGDIDDYTYSWSTGSTESQLFALTAGTYGLTFTDSEGCVTEEEVIVEFRPPLEVDASVTNISCFGADDGMISLDVTGGELPYAFSWVDGAEGPDRMNLPFGTYSLNIASGPDCNVFRSFLVNEPGPLGFTTEIIMQSDGLFMVVATVSGGTAPFVYSWSNGSSGAVLSDLPPGAYELQITDVNGCQFTDAVLVGTTNTTVAEDALLLKVFPNPSQSMCYVAHPMLRRNSNNIQVYNMNGQIVHPSMMLQEGLLTIDVQTLPAGTYWITIIEKQQRYLGKIIVE